MSGNFPAVLNFNQFISNQLPVSPLTIDMCFSSVYFVKIGPDNGGGEPIASYR
jgi:hypothetical protein